MSEQILNLILDKLTNIESDIKELKEFKTDATKLLNNLTMASADNQISNQQIRSTVMDTAEKIDKLYNKIDEFLTVGQRNEEEIYALGERSRDHEDRIMALESKQVV